MGKWSTCRDFSYWHQPIIELKGKCLGIYGYGTIAKSVAEVALAFGMRVISHTRTVPDNESRITFVDQASLLSQSDIITLHAPLTESTERFINSDSLALIKPNCILINTARGGLIDEAALSQALDEGKLQAALLDVLTEEPPAISNPLLRNPRCYITPHQAWASLESRQRLLAMLCESLKAYMQDRPINIVN